MNRGYRSWFQDLINVWTMPATMLKDKVMYRNFIHGVAFVNYKCCTCLTPLCLYFLNTPCILRYNAIYLFRLFLTSHCQAAYNKVKKIQLTAAVDIFSRLRS